MKLVIRAPLFFFLLGASVAPGLSGQDLFQRGEPRVYTGDHLEAVGMPLGGIGTGNIWIGGDGSLSVWQIFNNLTESARVPCSFFAVRAKTADGEPVVCVLEERDRPGFLPMKVRSFRGDYPFAWLELNRDGLPVEVSLEAFNPMIPLNLKDSSIPCALFRLTARNPGDQPVEVSFAAMAQNAVGYDGFSEIEGNFNWGYGGNRNLCLKRPDAVWIRMDVPNKVGCAMVDPQRMLHVGPPRRAVVNCKNLTRLSLPRSGPLPDAALAWIEGIGPESDRRLFQAVARVAEEGGGCLIKDPDKTFYEAIMAYKRSGLPAMEVFEDFESGSYEGWTLSGEAFGERPRTGTSPGQNPVSGFLGKGLVNSFLPDDQPTGTMTSKAFTIRHGYIGFLIGGGAHEGATCINLKVDGEKVRTAKGRNNEYLQVVQWDVSDLKGKEGVIEIVDRATGGWGHINVDHIVFSDAPPVTFLGKDAALKTISEAFPFEPEDNIFDTRVVVAARWVVSQTKKVKRADGGLDVSTGVASGPFGKGILYLDLEDILTDRHGMIFLSKAGGTDLEGRKEGLPKDAPTYGDQCLAVLDGEATVCCAWTDGEALAADLADDGRLEGPQISEASPLHETVNCALARDFILEPGGSRSVDFAVTWCFPNLERYGHQRNRYALDFPSAVAAAAHVCDNYDRLREETLRYHDTLYETNLPYWLLDCLSSQSCIFRTVNCFFAAEHAATGKPYFAGYEGCYGCCPLNCTHVWNYAQTHARLYPEIGRNLRWYDFMHYLKDDGETRHRQHRPHGAFIDGHCAVIEGAYREHLMSPDSAFLEEIWPGVKRAVNWLIEKIDPDRDGVNGGHQWNTYDVATSGAHTFIGSQYLSALAAGEKMALAMGDGEAAAAWAKIRKAGSKNQDVLLWNSKYYIQIAEKNGARDYQSGCHADQLLGQWWAHMLDLGYLYDRDHVVEAMKSVFQYNFRENFHGFEQRPRRYVLDNEGGLLMCSWPFGGRPDPFILYADEVWTGIEYSTAGLMIYEGLLEEAFEIVKTARDRYDGRLREGLNSGPGGNPFCELECGRFYARALSSWSLLLASQGFVYSGPEARIGFLPRWRPGDHKSFFCAAEGWGLFTQQREEGLQTSGIEVRYGRLRVKEIVLAAVPSSRAGALPAVTATLRGKPVAVEKVDMEREFLIEPSRSGGTEPVSNERLLITLEEEVVVQAGENLMLKLQWQQ